jgi:integrase
MASIKERTNKDGTTSHVVLFRHDGKQTSKSFADAKSAAKFRDAVNSVAATAALELLTARAPGRTIDSLFTEWLEHKRRGMTVEAHRDYERGYAKWIKPHFGWRDAELVIERDVQAWVDKTLRPRLGPKSVAKQHALLHGMYKWASSKTVGHIANDPCTETVLPERKKRPPRGLMIPELQGLLAAGERIGEKDSADVIAVMAGTGWRPGEVLGLVAGSVDVMPNGNVYVTMMSVYRRGEGIVEDGKTDAAGRRIRILGPGAAVVADRLVGKGLNAPIFPHPTTGKEWNPASFTRHYWPKVIAAAGLTNRGPTPYWLRHTQVYLCHAAGMTLPEIQRRVGHKSIQTTIDVYGQLIDGMTDESADKLDAMLMPAGSPEIVAGQIVELPDGDES